MQLQDSYLLFIACVAVGFLAGILFSYALIKRGIERRLLKDSLKRKDQFISLASHYLMNPLAIIQSGVSSLQERDSVLTAEKRHSFYDAIERGQQRLSIVTQQMMLVGEIDENNLTLQIGVANLYDTVSSAVTALDPFAREKQLTIHFDNQAIELQEARFDVRRMKQALIAVIDNAIKFSIEKGEVRIGVTYQSGIFTILVEDNGIGMPDEVLTHVTEKFFRGTDMYTFDYEGIGLGLHIAQAILRLHHGNVSFTSRPKKGTLVSIQFPSL